MDDNDDVSESCHCCDTDAFCTVTALLRPLVIISSM